MCAVVGSSFDNTYETTSRSCTSSWHIWRKTTLGILLLQCKSSQYLQTWAKPLLVSISSYFLLSSFRHAKGSVLRKHTSFFPLISFLGDARSLSGRKSKILDSMSVHKVIVCLGNTLCSAELQNILTSPAHLLLLSCLRSLFQRKQFSFIYLS